MQTRENRFEKNAAMEDFKKIDSKKGDKPIIKCDCGLEIPLLPDLKAMSKAIEAHVETHRKIEKDCSKTEAENEGIADLEAERILNFLTTQVLTKTKSKETL